MGAAQVVDCGDVGVLMQTPAWAHWSPILQGAPMSRIIGLRQTLSIHANSCTGSQSAAVTQGSPSPWLFVQRPVQHERPVAQSDSEVHGVPSA
jgi:hypothetical protein